MIYISEVFGFILPSPLIKPRRCMGDKLRVFADYGVGVAPDRFEERCEFDLT